jgi:hypothetical protein
LWVFFFFEAVDREDFCEFFYTLAGGLAGGEVGESCPPAEKAIRKNTAQRKAQNRRVPRKFIAVRLWKKTEIVKHYSPGKG